MKDDILEIFGLIFSLVGTSSLLISLDVFLLKLGGLLLLWGVILCPPISTKKRKLLRKVKEMIHHQKLMDVYWGKHYGPYVRTKKCRDETIKEIMEIND